LVLKNKQLLVLKTPDDIKYINFLIKLYPDSSYIHIVRDGRDSSCSMVANASTLMSNVITDYGKRNHLNAMRRWYEWEVTVRTAFREKGINPVSLKYEDLVEKPAETVQGICRGIGVDFEMGMLAYQKHDHELPDWEAGSYDLKKRKKDIDTKSVGRWRELFSKDEVKKVEELYGAFLKDIGYDV
jgi:hypothetical protein